MILIYHELGHLQRGWGRSFCDEVGLSVEVAQYHCNFICELEEGGAGPLNALCKMYDHVRDIVNGPATQAEVARQGCTGPTTIPKCDCCDDGN